MALFDATEKQQQFIAEVLKPENTFIAYGGAAGGGKTYVSLAILVMLCKFYPGSRWCVIRKSLTEIRLNTIPSFFKLVPKSFVESYNKSEFNCTFTNGSQIIFKGENIHDDPDLQWMDGFEVNGFLLEQVEELSYKTFDKCKLRAGRWVINPMPPIKILMTLNPSINWTKETIYKPYSEGTLKPPYCYVPAKISDNKHLPKEYVDGLSNLDPLTYARFVDGDWEAFAVSKPFMYCFDEKVHVSEEAVYNPKNTIYLSFDFNVDPAICVLSQKGILLDGTPYIHFVDEVWLNNSNLYEICEHIKAKYGDAHFMVTGDASGRNRHHTNRGNVNSYTIIKNELQLKDAQFKIPGANPPISESRTLSNSILSRHPNVKFHPEKCKRTIDDLKYTEVDENGNIDKSKNKHRSHLLDAVRYDFNTFHHNFVKKS